MKSRAARLLAFVAAFSMVLGATPAFADSISITDARQEADPDILKLTLINKSDAVVFEQKYEELDYVQVETFYIRWGKPQHYFVNRGNYDEDAALETRLTYVQADGDHIAKSCGDITAGRNQDTETSRVRVPRTCLPKAYDRIAGKGTATMGLYNSDTTRLTDRIARG